MLISFFVITLHGLQKQLFTLLSQYTIKKEPVYGTNSYRVATQFRSRSYLYADTIISSPTYAGVTSKATLLHVSPSPSAVHSTKYRNCVAPYRNSLNTIRSSTTLRQRFIKLFLS